MNPKKEMLRRRELELQRLMRQMQLDQLQKSRVYQHLEQELLALRQPTLQEQVEPSEKEA
jgi:hypothetical protein